MGFYLKKSIRVGLLRFNLSNSGIGVSAGIKGLRVGFGPRGNYIHAGVGGVYYRSTLTPNETRKRPQDTTLTSDSSGNEMKEIDSDMRMLFENSSSDSLVNEIVEKLGKWTIWKPMMTLTAISPFYLPIEYFSVGLILTIIAYNWDQARKSVVLFYDFDEEKKEDYEDIIEECENAFKVKKFWHIPSAGLILDWKKNAGATGVVKRNLTPHSLKPPSFIKTNIPVPTVQVGTQTLCIFPDKILLLTSKTAAAIDYKDLNIDISPTRFIEEERVPSDAEILDYTWLYVNKSGGPDRRFKNNRKLPICKYEDIELTSSTGLNERLMVSKCGAFDGLRNVVQRISRAA